MDEWRPAPGRLSQRPASPPGQPLVIIVFHPVKGGRAPLKRRFFAGGGSVHFRVEWPARQFGVRCSRLPTDTGSMGRRYYGDSEPASNPALRLTQYALSEGKYYHTLRAITTGLSTYYPTFSILFDKLL